MANTKVRLVLLCKTPNGSRRYPAVVGENGRVKPQYALVAGKAVHFPDSRYQLRVYEGDRMVYIDAGSNASDAKAARDRHANMLTAKKAAVAAGIEIKEDSPAGRKLLTTLQSEYADRLLARGALVSHKAYTKAMADFLNAVDHVFVDEVTEKSLLAYYRFLRGIRNADRTIHNKHIHLSAFLRWAGVDVKAMDIKPSYTKREVEVYDAKDLTKLFSVCTPYQKVMFETLLKTGMREQEAVNLEWSNVNFRGREIYVRTYEGVTIKDRAERSIPLADDLAETLRIWRDKHPKARLVLGTRSGAPNGKMLRSLKRAAKKAGLNCGYCKGCNMHKECGRWKLKTFRSTFTTTMLRNGIDARTVMSWTGHEDLETVMKYLSPSKNPDLQRRVSAINWTV